MDDDDEKHDVREVHEIAETLQQVRNLTEIARALRERAGVIVDINRQPLDEKPPTLH